MLYFKENGEFHPVPLPEIGTYNTGKDEFYGRLKKLATPSHPLDSVSFANTYKGQKRERYLKAAGNLVLYPTRAVGTGVGMFLKYETYNLTEKPDAKCRGIYPRSDEFLVDHGRRIQSMEKKCYNNINTIFGHVVVFKGMNPKKQGLLIEKYWNEFNDPVAIQFDASAFEASLSIDVLRYNHAVQNLYVRNDKRFKQLQNAQLHNKITARCKDGSLKVEIEGKKMSGDADTSQMANVTSARNAYDFFKEVGIDKYRLVINGDDVFAIFSKRQLDNVIELGKAFYWKRGFRMVFEKPVYEIEKISFCQSSPIWTEEGYRMVRRAQTACSKDAISRKDLKSKRNFERWIASVGVGGLACNGGIPIMQEYYQQYVRNSNGAKIFDIKDPMFKQLMYRSKGMSEKYSQVHPRTRLSFYIAFGILPDEQKAIENYYSTVELSHGLREEDISETPLLPW